MTITDEKKVIKLILEKINEVKDLGRSIGYNNILYNEQYKELELSMLLGHDYNEGQGEDASINNESCEYKTMVGESGSFQYHWISQPKLEKYRKTPHHYFAVYDKETAKLDRVYYLPVDKVLPQLEEVYQKGENKRGLIEKDKNIDAHKSFSLTAIKKLGADLVYGVEKVSIPKVKKAKKKRSINK